MGGFVFDLPSKDERSEESTTRTRAAPTPATFLYIMQNFPDIIPDISEESITGRSKSNGLSKAILIAQVGWFCASCISRLVENLPLSLLEVSTVAHGFCTLLTYFVWWSKPLNIDITMTTPMRGPRAREVYERLQRQTTPIHDSITGIRNTKPLNFTARVLKFLIMNKSAPGLFVDYDVVSAPGQRVIYSHMVSSRKILVVGILIQIPYGFFHLLGWNAVFPTSYECLFWKVSIIITASMGFFSALLLVVGEMVGMDSARFRLTRISVIACLYFITSGFFTVESVRQLFFLPPAAYELASWSNYLPHFS